MPSRDEIPERIVQRLLDRRELNEATGCMETTTAVGSHGYGQFGWNEGGVPLKTTHHRALWIAFNGVPPEGWHVHHTCFNRRCATLEHLAIMPMEENSARTSGEDWELGTCKNGHPREGNTVIASAAWNKRACRPCRLATSRKAQRKYRARKRAERLALKEEGSC